MIEGDSNDYPALETSGPRWQVFSACMARIAAAIRADCKCKSWLASAVGPEAVDDLLDHPEKYFAVASHFLLKDGTVDRGTDASTDDVPGYRAIINLADFHSNSEAYNWDTIVHEMAHVLLCEGFDQNDADSDEAQAVNAALLRRHCCGVLDFSPRNPTAAASS
jgi:hypothetical protein